MDALGMRFECSLQFFQDGFARIPFRGNRSHTEQPYSVFQLKRGCGTNQHRHTKMRPANEWTGRESHKRREEQERTLAQHRTKTTQKFCFKKRPRPLKLGRFCFRSVHPRYCPALTIAIDARLAATDVWQGLELDEIAKVSGLKSTNSYGFTRRGNLQAARYQTLGTNALL